MYAVTKEGGMLMSPADVCLTPAGPDLAPVPYPNFGQPELGEPACDMVLVCGVPALNASSTIPMTDGDEAGVGGGVISAEFSTEARFTQMSAKVRLRGCPAVRLTAATTQNNSNCVGACLEPSQTLVIIME